MIFLETRNGHSSGDIHLKIKKNRVLVWLFCFFSGSFQPIYIKSKSNNILFLPESLFCLHEMRVVYTKFRSLDLKMQLFQDDSKSGFCTTLHLHWPSACLVFTSGVATSRGRYHHSCWPGGRNLVVWKPEWQNRNVSLILCWKLHGTINLPMSREHIQLITYYFLS